MPPGRSGHGSEVRGGLGVLAAVALVGFGPLAGGGAAQEIRGWTSTSFQLVELRPLERRSFDPETLEVGPDGRLLFEGTPVDCAPA